ncbi:FtsX-like permease family protein [Streptacidiphilus cavernicola]|uniref:FtsX-like permease family protein n=1 Tax=Streptacidiphilus cavernicola TaxID=3342716 RepID=A0ABV6W213_9ACTN
MNLFKRAWWQLTSQPGRTALMVGVFAVVCTLVLSGFLIRSAAARAADRAKAGVGATADLKLDFNALLAAQGAPQQSGAVPAGVMAASRLPLAKLDRLCASAAVVRCNYTVDGLAAPAPASPAASASASASADGSGAAKLYQPVPPPVGTDTTMTDWFSVQGIRDQAGVPDFHNGDSKIISGSGITPTSPADMVVIEQRLARADHLKVGDKLHLRVGQLPSQGGPPVSKQDFVLTVGGIYQNSAADPGQYQPADSLAANLLYLTPLAATGVTGMDASQGATTDKADFTLHGPDDLARLVKDEKAAGIDPTIWPISVNDQQYRQLVGPIDKTARFATVTLWLVAVAGAAVLALITAAAMRGRRKELGILMSLGERKPRLVGQQLAETVVCGLVAVGIATACASFVSQAVGDHLLAGDVADARSAAAQQQAQPDPSDPTGGANGPSSGGTPQVQPIDRLRIGLGAGDLAGVGATGLAIAVLATVLPGVRTLRLTPRDILSKGN